MTERPLFRFLHTGDFQLGMVPYGIDNVPDSVANRLLDSTWESVGRVFSTAIQNQVDFVLLTGDLVANGYGSSPRTIEFLRDQFFRLQSAGIAVYCSRDCFAFNRPSNATATTGWPEWCELPANVHFLSDRDPVVVHTENNRLLAEIVTAGNSARTDVFSIQVLASSKKTASRNVNYAAACGIDQCGQLSADDQIWSSGSPQGRSPNSVGKRGCLIVDVFHNHACSVQMAATADVMWQNETVRCDSNSVAHTQLVSRMTARMREFAERSQNENQMILVDWNIGGSGLNGLNLAQLLADVRATCAQLEPYVYCVNSRFENEYFPESSAHSGVLADYLKLAETGTARGGDFTAELLQASWLSDSLLRANSQSELATVRSVALFGTELF